MNDYSIHVLNGKVIGNSVFYLLADDCFRKECRKLRDFTDALDKIPAEKKKNIAEYKCAKYRYAAISLIHSIIYNNNRFLCNTKAKPVKKERNNVYNKEKENKEILRANDRQ